MLQKVFLVSECDVDSLIEDIGARISINQMRLEENDNKLNRTLCDNINFAMGMFQALKLLDLVDEASEKDIKKGLDIFY